MKHYRKEALNTPIRMALKAQLRWEPVEGNVGIIEVEDGSPEAKVLADLVERNRGFISVLKPSEYEELKKRPANRSSTQLRLAADQPNALNRAVPAKPAVAKDAPVIHAAAPAKPHGKQPDAPAIAKGVFGGAKPPVE